MNRFSRIRHHVDMKDVRKRHLEETAAKKLEEKRLKEEAEQIRAEYEKWKSDWKQDIFGEGMTTQMLHGILPPAGDTDLVHLPLGLTGGTRPENGDRLGLIDYDGNLDLAGNTTTDGSEYTVLSNMEPVTFAPDPNGVGQFPRLFDPNTNSFPDNVDVLGRFVGTIGGSEFGFTSGVPGYQKQMGRNYQVLGSHTNRPLENGGGYKPIGNFGSNDTIGKSITASDPDDGYGVALGLGGAGSPVFASFKPIDATEVDTIKIHAVVQDSAIRKANERGNAQDSRVMIYYWAGNHPDYQSSGAATINTHSTDSATPPADPDLSSTTQKQRNGDGWRPIHMKPDGTIDNTVDPYIIDSPSSGKRAFTDVNQNSGSTSHNKVTAFSLKLPSWTQTKDARFMIYHSWSDSRDKVQSINSIRFQRKNTLRVPSISKPLTDIEAAPFVRVGQSVDQNAEQRKKRVRDMIKASLKYGQTKFGDGVVTSTNID